MLTLQQNRVNDITEFNAENRSLDELLSREWLLTNDRGGYSASTIIGCNTHRYHGLLVGSLNPPIQRILALSTCLEMLICNGESQYLTSFEFPDKFAPEPGGTITTFQRDIAAHIHFQLDRLTIVKSIYLWPDSDTAAVVYDFKNVHSSFDFIWRPFVAMRDFHGLQKSFTVLRMTREQQNLLIRREDHNSGRLCLNAPCADFEKDPQWWFNFTYRVDARRGQESAEDLWAPGFYRCRIDKPQQVVFWAQLNPCGHAIEAERFDLKAMKKALGRHQKQILKSASMPKDDTFGKLALAADQFVTCRQMQDQTRTTILAGYPWFADWGRDAFISLSGLLLETGRFEQARSVLTTFAQACENGMIPNRFDDYSDTAHFNSIDASLWFIHAAFEYLSAANDRKTFEQELLPAILDIIGAYQNGTIFDTRADTDGLITAGNAETQLTWMDAKCEGTTFTPRYGKAVEVNALWYNALCLLADYFTDRDDDKAAQYQAQADTVKQSFQCLFWNEAAGYLNDCIYPDGGVDTSLRPNQIFAVSLPFSPLEPHMQSAVVEAVRQHLYTPYGLRTLEPGNPNFQPCYDGPQYQRDKAYHQGTVWPYLIGPFIEAYLKVHQFDAQRIEKAKDMIRPLLDHFNHHGCLGQLCEVFDGLKPEKPKGCMAQAWSVAELIRIYKMTHLD